MSTKTSDAFRERAEQAEDEARNSPLPQVRARSERSAAAWNEMADKELKREEERAILAKKDD